MDPLVPRDKGPPTLIAPVPTLRWADADMLSLPRGVIEFFLRPVVLAEGSLYAPAFPASVNVAHVFGSRHVHRETLIGLVPVGDLYSTEGGDISEFNWRL
jgi:hypothetical protein